MTPALCNMKLLTGVATRAEFILRDAAGQPVDLGGAVINAVYAKADQEPTSLDILTGEQTGSFAVLIPALVEQGMYSWTLSIQTNHMTSLEQAARGSLFVRENIDTRDPESPIAKLYLLDLSDSVRLTVDPVDVAWWASQDALKSSQVATQSAQSAQVAATAAAASQSQSLVSAQNAASSASSAFESVGQAQYAAQQAGYSVEQAGRSVDDASWYANEAYNSMSSSQQASSDAWYYYNEMINNGGGGGGGNFLYSDQDNTFSAQRLYMPNAVKSKNTPITYDLAAKDLPNLVQMQWLSYPSSVVVDGGLLRMQGGGSDMITAYGSNNSISRDWGERSGIMLSIRPSWRAPYIFALATGGDVVRAVSITYQTITLGTYKISTKQFTAGSVLHSGSEVPGANGTKFLNLSFGIDWNGPQGYFEIWANRRRASPGDSLAFTFPHGDMIDIQGFLLVMNSALTSDKVYFEAAYKISHTYY